MKKVILENTGGRLISIDLNHQSAQKTKKTFYQGTHDASTGKVGQVVRELYIHETILIPVGGSKSDLPMWVAELDMVLAAQAKGELHIKPAVDMDAQMARLRAREKNFTKDALQSEFKSDPEPKSMLKQISDLVKSTDIKKKEAE